MTTLQAVWPPEFTERRARFNAVETAIVEMQLRQCTIGLDDLDRHRLHDLRTSLRNLPCPHWDLQHPEYGGSEWTCDGCGATVGPTWVPLLEQEAAVRRLKNRLLSRPTQLSQRTGQREGSGPRRPLRPR